MQSIQLALVVVAIAILIWWVSRRESRRDHFVGGQSVTVSWKEPSYNNPANLRYNWSACIISGYTFNQGLCPSPLTPPIWSTFSGSTSAAGQTSIALDVSTCSNCGYGEKLNFAVQAIDIATLAAGAWTIVQIDLSSSLKAESVSLTDPSGESLATGSTGFVYNLSLSSPVFTPANKAMSYVIVYRGSESFEYAGMVPFTTASGAAGTYSGSFLTDGASLWTGGKFPGALQTGDRVVVYGLVYNPGNNGPVYYSGVSSQTVQVESPGAPSQVVWHSD